MSGLDCLYVTISGHDCPRFFIASARAGLYFKNVYSLNMECSLMTQNVEY